MRHPVRRIVSVNRSIRLPAAGLGVRRPRSVVCAALLSAASARPAASDVAGDGGPAPSRPRPVRRLVVLACTLALSAGPGACTITLERDGSAGSSGPADTSSRSATDDPAQGPSQDPHGGMPTSSGSPTALPPLTNQGGTASPDPERPGAAATITSKEWVVAQQTSIKRTMTPVNGQVVVDRSYETVVIEGDVTNLTVSGDGVTVIVDYAQSIAVNSSARVYVRDTRSVTVTGSYSTVLWAGSTPQIQDTGSGNTMKNQAEGT